MRWKILFIFAALAISTLSGCGGDGGAPALATAPVVVSKGVITDTGSIFVNGTFYNISSAAITLDGLPGSQSDLKVGMVVTVKGIFNNKTSHITPRKATSVEFADNLEGPVDSVNAFSNALLVMGQPVLLMTGTAPNKTVFGNFTSLSQLTPQFANISTQSTYSVVKVSGFPNGINGLQATRIDLITQGVVFDPASSIPVEIKGTTSGLDPLARIFQIGGLTVDYSTINPIFLPIPLASGQFVMVQGFSSGYTPGAAPTLIATSVKSIKEGITAKGGNHVVIEGFVSELSGTSFSVEGTSVNAGTLSLSNIANAVKVRVEGTFRNGVLQASKITIL